MAPIAMASLPRDGSAKCAAVVATTPTPNRGARAASAALRSSSSGWPWWVSSTLTRSAPNRSTRSASAASAASGPPVDKRLAHMALAASGEDVPVPTRGLGQRVEVVARLALLAAGQVRRGELPRQPPVPLRPARQHQQVRARRVGILGAGHVAQRELGTEHRRHVEFPGRLGEPDHPVQPVVVGQRDGPQVEPGGLLDEFLRRARTVEEAVRRVRVQFGVRGTGATPVRRWLIRRLVAPALARPGRAVATVAGRLGQAGPGTARLAGEHALHLAPASTARCSNPSSQSIEHVFDASDSYVAMTVASPPRSRSYIDRRTPTRVRPNIDQTRLTTSATAPGRRPGHLAHRTRRAARAGEGRHPRTRRDRRPAPAAADGRDAGLHADRRRTDPSRWPTSSTAARQLIVYNHMWSDGAEWQCGGCTGFTSQFTRLDFLDRLRRPIRHRHQRTHRRGTGLQGQGRQPDGLVLVVGEFVRRRRRRGTRHRLRRQRLPPRRRHRLPHLAHRRPRHRAAQPQLRADRPAAVGSPGGVAGLTRGLAAVADLLQVARLPRHRQGSTAAASATESPVPARIPAADRSSAGRPRRSRRR